MRILVTGTTGYIGGRLYWNLLYPIHRIMFSGMVRRVAGLAEKGVDA